MAVMINTVNISDANLVQDQGNIYLDVNNNEVYDNGDDELLTKSEAETLLGLSSATSATVSLKDLISSVDGNLKTKTATEILSKLTEIKSMLTKVNNALNKLQSSSGTSTGATIPEKIKQLQELKTQLLAEAKEVYDDPSVQAKFMTEPDKTSFNALKAEFENFQSKNNTAGPKAAMAQNSGGAGAQAKAAAAQPGDGGAKFSWSAGNNGDFDFSSYLNSVYADQAILNGKDSVNTNQAQQKKMMMLFFYFAKMAMSGDLGAMYRFMHFITYIISKDKALQNINLSSKLIELENSSREALEELLNTETPSNGDTAASYNFTKVLEKTNQTQSMNATSQKLLAQMLEVQAQVVETLTGMAKNTLDAEGRVGQRVSSR